MHCKHFNNLNSPLDKFKLMDFDFSGYMSPEYAMHGQFSVKSDVFSFGVLVLEIISGRKNTNFNQSDNIEDLLGYVSEYLFYFILQQVLIKPKTY